MDAKVRAIGGIARVARLVCKARQNWQGTCGLAETKSTQAKSCKNVARVVVMRESAGGERKTPAMAVGSDVGERKTPAIAGSVVGTPCRFAGEAFGPVSRHRRL